jgi:NAD(P)-dependent dehydrogenase (short-subunit alcohol dehydrogenase family)
MELAGKVVVVTGGANGIGRALCCRFAEEGAAGIVVADLDADGARGVAEQIDGVATRCDVSIETDVRRLVELAEEVYGPIDLFCSNAGITTKGGEEASNADWTRLWDVNVMAHVFAARAVLPSMLARGNGYLLQTSSAAGVLTEIGSAPYSVTKHAAVAFAEWLSITYQKQGIRVSCLCPAGVDTGFLDPQDPIHQFLHATSVTVDQVADCVVAGLAEERFLMLPHSEVREFFAFKGQDYDRWLRNFARLKEKMDRRATECNATTSPDR